jgi:hypothetical protein
LWIAAAVVRAEEVGAPIAACARALLKATPSVGGEAALGEWARRYRTSSTGQWGFLEWPMALECLSELSPAYREALFDVGDCDGPDCRWIAQERIARHGLHAGSVVPLAAALDRLVAESYASSGEPWHAVRAQLEALERLPAEERAALRARMELRFRVHRAAERFADASHPYYVARLDGEELHFPDGVRRRVTRGIWGRKYVWIPYKDVLRTQEYLNGAVVAKYRDHAWLGFWGFRGYLAPDGRVVIIDQHHRTTAYAQNHAKRGIDWQETLLPFLLEGPAEDGYRYRTLAHWNILASAHQVPFSRNSLRWRHDPEWVFLGPEERERALSASETEERIPLIRRWYYASTGLEPLASAQ